MHDFPSYCFIFISTRFSRSCHYLYQLWQFFVVCVLSYLFDNSLLYLWLYHTPKSIKFSLAQYILMQAISLRLATSNWYHSSLITFITSLCGHSTLCVYLFIYVHNELSFLPLLYHEMKMFINYSKLTMTYKMIQHIMLNNNLQLLIKT